MRVIETILLFVLTLTTDIEVSGQDFYRSSDARISFFSSAPIEDIHAVSEKGISVIDPASGEIAFKVDIQSFDFEKKKMQEHFNENFMESNQYPSASFRGKLSEALDFTETGTYQVTVEGTLEVHGKKRNRKIPITLLVNDTGLRLESSFQVACKDHDITIPKILWQNIAEVVKVTVRANYKK